MKTIKKIFFDDVLGLVKNFFALVIVIGLCFLPAFYAWFNIYSNWDPYGNTGALKFAAVSLDNGYTDEDGQYHNQGETIIDNLHENTAVNWQFVDSEDQAIDGVYSGEYYAAIVIDENFTFNMYNVLSEGVERPTLHFYENQKKNPVATKISDTVVQTVQNNINVAFTEVVVSEVISGASDLSAEITEKDSIGTIMDKLEQTSADLTRYQNAITQIIDNDAKLQETLATAQSDANSLKEQAQNSAKAVGNSSRVIGNGTTTVNSYSDTLKQAAEIAENGATDINESLNEAVKSQDAVAMATALKKAVLDALKVEKIIYSLPDSIGSENIEQEKTRILSALQTIEKTLSVLNSLGIDTNTQLAMVKQTIDQINSIDVSTSSNEDKIAKIDEKIALVEGIDVDALAEFGQENLLNAINGSLEDAKSAEDLVFNTLVPKLNTGLSSLTGMLTDTNSLLNTVGETFGNLSVMFEAIDNSVDAANTSLEKTNEAIAYINGRLIDVIDQVNSSGAEEKIEVLINTLTGDPDTYSKFFSTPVEVKTEAVYPIENYGSAIAPFYSTLAFWVGALILVAIIKIKPDKSRYPNASERQLYFGRYVLYWTLGQIQSVIIIIGDIYLLHVQCIHPWLFLLAGSFIATTFTLLIYSLVTTWGDVGKALAVVLVVIQIAGSSGTYPIELLPEFFQKIYIFFPFPYAINAIRECLCGTYKFDYLENLGVLVIFMGVALVIGLLIRIPFAELNHYMEERMEDTEMM